MFKNFTQIPHLLAHSFVSQKFHMVLDDKTIHLNSHSRLTGIKPVASERAVLRLLPIHHQADTYGLKRHKITFVRLWTNYFSNKFFLKNSISLKIKRDIFNNSFIVPCC